MAYKTKPCHFVNVVLWLNYWPPQKDSIVSNLNAKFKFLHANNSESLASNRYEGLEGLII